MAWFDDPKQYYRDLPAITDALAQGDIVVAATTVIFPGDGESDVAGPTTLDESRRSTVWLASGATLPGAPALSANTRWGLAMVVPHSCALDKDWNERISDLIDAGHPRDDAIRRASEERDLDPFITLAPVLSLTSLPESKRLGARMNRRLGNFPICPNADIPDAFVDLAQLSTVHYSTIPTSSRVASISDSALAHFHFAVAMHFAYRSLSGLKELEDAVGRQIVNISVTERTKGRLVVSLILDDGQELVLEGEKRGREVPAFPIRVNRV